MKLRAGKYSYSFQGSSIRSAVIWDRDPEVDPNAICYPLTQLDPGDMAKLYEKMWADEEEFVAMPLYISNMNIEYAQELWFYPIPDRDLVAQVEYETVHFL